MKFKEDLNKYQSSKYEIKDDKGKVITLQRMTKNKFISVYKDFSNNKEQSTGFIELLNTKKPYNISVFELKLLISTFSNESKNKKIIINYLKYIQEHSTK